VSARIANIKKAVEEHAGCAATHRESAPVTEGYLDQKIAWEGVVEVFDLDGHPKAKRAYGWQFWVFANALSLGACAQKKETMSTGTTAASTRTYSK